MLKKVLLIILLLMGGAQVRLLNAQHYLFSHLNKDESGLSYDSIREIFQDSRGFVWIGTYKGLSRYDGSRFKNYGRDDFGITSDFVNVIREDLEGNLWIGTDNGIVIYDYKQDVFCNLDMYLGGNFKVPVDRIYAIERNSKGVMWVSSMGSGLYSYDPLSKTFRHHPLSCEGTFFTNIYRIALDRNDNLYLAVYCDDIYLADAAAESCSPLNLDKDTDIFKGDDVEGLVVSSKSSDIIYVASKRRGIVEVDIRNRRCRQLCPLEKDVRPKNMIIDSNKYLWLSTTNGLVCYDLYAEKYYVYRSNPRDSFAISDSYITTTHKDNKGGLWVGTQYGGLNYYSPSHDKFRKCYTLSDGTSLEGAIVRSFAEDKNGNLWVGTERRGLLKYSHGVLTAVSGGNLPQSVLAIADDVDCLWLGTQKGISKMDYSTGRIKHYKPFDNEDKDNRVVTIYRSMSGDIYVATTVGVMRYVRESDNFLMVPGLVGITMEHMSENSRGILWLASYSTGVYEYDLSDGCVRNHYSPQTGSEQIPDMISSICIDNADNTWVIGFSSGFFRYHGVKSEFQTYSTSTLDYLPTDVFFMALPDDFGNMWLSSDMGLLEFNPRKSVIRVFTKANGLLDKEFTKAAILLRNGTMAFGSANGFVVFNPRDLQAGNAISKVTITDMYLGSKPVGPHHREGKFSGNIDAQEKVVLDFSDNSFGFSFAMLDSVNPSSDKILCRLEGYDEDWTDVSATKAMHWTNVPAGEYQLCLSNGEFSGNYVMAHHPLTIVVKPKFWASPLGVFIILIMSSVLVSFGVFLFIKSQKARERSKIEEYRKKKDQELLHEKMAFFSNIIHEIKTPLTLIRTPLQKIFAVGNVSENIREELDVIRSSADYMNDLVRELLEYVRLEEHGYVLDLRNIDIVDRTGFLCYNFSETAHSRNIKISYRHEVDSLVTALDTIAFRKIINNLMDNGVKYAESFVKVSLSVDDGHVVISFQNDGAPIPASRRESIFKPFVQFSADQSPYAQSFGIGLTYAKNLAELHGGCLFLSDKTDCTEFVLKLPIRTVTNEVEENEPEVEIAKRSDLPLVLIVEDNSSLLTYLKKNLKHQYNVIAAQSAEKALVLLASYKVDIILTDVALQGMSGVELCRRINNSETLSHIPVVVVSAISSVETKMKCMEYGAVTYIEKPYSMDFLQACIKGTLEKRATLRATYGVAVSVADNIKLINRDDDFLRRLEKVVLENMGNSSFTNKQLEEMLYMGHSTLNRKMKALLDMTPNDYIRTKRLAAAADMLESGKHRVNEVCYAVGFNSPSYFAKCFKKAYGVLPAEWAKEKLTSEKAAE